MICKGTIRGLVDTWLTGIAELVIDDERMGRVVVFCEEGPTIRSFHHAFGGVIGADHTFRNEAIAGREIYYSLDEYGILEAFTPAEEASPRMVAEYEGDGVGESCGSGPLGLLPLGAPVYDGGPAVAGREITRPRKRKLSENN